LVANELAERIARSASRHEGLYPDLGASEASATAARLRDAMVVHRVLDISSKRVMFDATLIRT